jgi:hypothetical protein
MPLGNHLGCKDPSHVNRWLRAMWKGRDAIPRCEALNKRGEPCGYHRMKGSRYCHCHLKGPARTAIDAKRVPHLLHAARSLHKGEYGRSHAIAALARIERREQHLAWKANPLLQLPPTICLSPIDERRVRRYLFDRHGLDLDVSQFGQSRPPSPRCVDRCVWAGALVLRHIIDDAKAARRIKVALADDAKFFGMLDAIEGA